MCGIAGAYSFNSTLFPDKERVKKMSDSIAHRGPDGEGLWQSDCGTAVFAHRRLSIIDLSDLSKQPMISDDGNFVIVFNGEIYNFCELKEDLIKQGVSFNSNSDTEVLLTLYIKYGRDCLELMDGMFAFSIWDNHKKQLFCARDRFGEKPFYYCIKDGLFVFGSEIKAIRAYFSDLKINYLLVQKYLNDEYSFGDIDTPFNEIVTLPPATCMVINEKGVTTSVYWEIDLLKKTKLPNDEAYFNRFAELLMQSVRIRLRSDVPVGSSLSGGLDSSTIVGALSELDVPDMRTFSARFRSEKDEGAWIADVIGKTGMSNHEVWPEENGLINELEKITWHNEFPLASGSVYAQWCVFSLPRDYGVKVLLDGQGADEYLCGYDELKYYAIWNLYHTGHLLEFLREKKYFKKHYGAHGKLGYLFMLDPIMKLLGIKRAVFKNGYSLKEQLKFYTHTHLGELLRYADRNSMAHSIEVRLPFLSHKLVEFVFSIPDNLIYRNGKTKFVLREAMKDVLPDTVYARTNKIGFAPPQQDWINSEVFQQKYAVGLKVLSEMNLKPGNNQFRNLATSVFVSLFR